MITIIKPIIVIEYSMSNHDSDDYENTIEGNIELIQNELDKFEHNTRILWEIIILPYITNPCREILDGLTEYDYDKFLKFMTENSPAHKKLLNGLKWLNQCKK